MIAADRGSFPSLKRDRFAGGGRTGICGSGWWLHRLSLAHGRGQFCATPPRRIWSRPFSSSPGKAGKKTPDRLTDRRITGGYVRIRRFARICFSLPSGRFRYTSSCTRALTKEKDNYESKKNSTIRRRFLADKKKNLRFFTLCWPVQGDYFLIDALWGLQEMVWVFEKRLPGPGQELADITFSTVQVADSDVSIASLCRPLRGQTELKLTLPPGTLPSADRRTEIMGETNYLIPCWLRTLC